MRRLFLALVMCLFFYSPAWAGELRILSWNVQDFCPSQNRDSGSLTTESLRDRELKAMADLIIANNIDAFCMTECETSGLNSLMHYLQHRQAGTWAQTTVPNNNNAGGEEIDIADPQQIVADDDIIIVYNKKTLMLESQQIWERARPKKTGVAYYNAHHALPPNDDVIKASDTKVRMQRAPLAVKFQSEALGREVYVVVIHAKSLGDGNTHTSQLLHYTRLDQECSSILADDPEASLLICGDWNNRYIKKDNWNPNSDGFELWTLLGSKYTHIGPPEGTHTYASSSTLDHVVILGNWGDVTPSCKALGLAEGSYYIGLFSDHVPLLTTLTH
jgi:hypothetical protein